MYGSDAEKDCSVADDALLYKRENVPFSAAMPYDETNITIPITQQLLNNGSYYAHIFFGKGSSVPSACSSSYGLTHSVYRMHFDCCLIPRAESLQAEHDGGRPGQPPHGQLHLHGTPSPHS